jgi:hypothetical protein
MRLEDRQRAMQATVRIKSRGPERCVYKLNAKPGATVVTVRSHLCGAEYADDEGDSGRCCGAETHEKRPPLPC